MGKIGIFLRDSIKAGLIATLVILFLVSLVSGKTMLSLFLGVGGLFAATVWGQIASGLGAAVAVGIVTMAARKHNGMREWLIKRIPKRVLGEPVVRCQLVPGGAVLVGTLIKVEGRFAHVRQFNGWMLAITWLKWEFPVELIEYVRDANGNQRMGLDLILEICGWGGQNGNGANGSVKKSEAHVT
ncbi:MAG: hypothetical protein Q7S84_01205 [bacterium]|nr:hypothetical protein [bacterium]